MQEEDSTLNQITLKLQGDARLPIYQRLAESLKSTIIDQKWRPGDRLPSEKELAAQYSVAPGTARQAISLLTEEGILVRRHGSGTFVRKPTFDASLFRFFRFQDKEGEREIPESRILSREVIPAPSVVSKALDLKPESPVIFISRLRLLSGEPVIAEEVWLDHARFEAFMVMDEDDIGPLLYPVYDSHFDQIVASAKECLTVEVAGSSYSRLLHITPATPVIVIERLALGFDGKPIEWRRSRGRADRFQYHIDIH
jgi:GntR family transcriptional regulator